MKIYRLMNPETGELSSWTTEDKVNDQLREMRKGYKKHVCIQLQVVDLENDEVVDYLEGVYQTEKEWYF